MAVHPVLRFLRRIRASDQARKTPDADLLARFVTSRDEAAFAALVQRHGPMVLRLCVRVLGDSPDAEDAFQAAFLVLARRAHSVSKPELLGNWLYGVTYRTALKVRAGAARQQTCVKHKRGVDGANPADEAARRELREVLDHELSRLPDRYRVPLVLHYLEGHTQEEVAQLLGCPRNTIATRLARACERLRGRLARSGLALSSGGLAVALSEEASAALPTTLLHAAVKAAALFAAGRSPLAPTVVSLAEGVIQAMFLTKVKIALGCVLLLVIVATGAGVLAHQSQPPGDQAQSAVAVPKGDPEGGVAEKPGKQLAAPPKVERGKSYIVFPIRTELQRTLLNWGEAKMAKAFVLVDGMSVVRPDGSIDSNALDFQGMRDALKPYRGKESGLFVLTYYQAERSGEGTQLLNWALEGFGRSAGFDKTWPVQTWFNMQPADYDWDKLTAQVDTWRTDADEPATGNDLVKVYPVRTALSRQLTNANCVVVIRAPLIPEGDGLKPEIRDAIRLFVGRLKLPRKEAVLFRIDGGRSGEEAYRQFIKKSKELATWLGFKGSSVQG